MLPSDIGARRKTPRLAGIWRLSVALSLGVAVLIPIVQFATLFPLTVNVPTWDQWNFASIWRAYFHHEAVFPRLIAPFNGHFMFLPRVLFFVLGLLTRWNVRAEVLVTYVAFAAILAIFVAMLARSDSRLLVVAAPVSAYLFYLDQSESFLAGITLSEAMAVLGIVASIFFLTGRSLSRARFALALASAIAASLSWGIGLVAWPVGLLAILLRRERRRIEATVWCLTGGLFVLAAQRVFQESSLDPEGFCLSPGPARPPLLAQGDSVGRRGPGPRRSGAAPFLGSCSGVLPTTRAVPLGVRRRLRTGRRDSHRAGPRGAPLQGGRADRPGARVSLRARRVPARGGDPRDGWSNVDRLGGSGTPSSASRFRGASRAARRGASLPNGHGVQGMDSGDPELCRDPIGG